MLPKGDVLFTSHGTTIQGHVVKTELQDSYTIVDLYYHPASMAPAMWPTMALPQPKQEFLLPERVDDGRPEGVSSQEIEDIRKAYISGLEVADIAKQVYSPRPGPELALAKKRVRDTIAYLLGGKPA
jgi:hypothetical protein